MNIDNIDDCDPIRLPHRAGLGMPLKGGGRWHVGIMGYAQQETALLRDCAISYAARSGEESDQLLSAHPSELNYLTDTLCRQHDSQRKKKK